MFSLNIENGYSVSGTNKAQAYWLSDDMESGQVPADDPRLKNGFSGLEIDTSKKYYFDEENRRWLLFENN